MARIRTIKPEFFTSEDITELPALARLLYIALWCEADKEGCFAWKPKTFKMRYLPADDCDVFTICDALVTRGLVVLYGDGLAVIPTFKDHQHINPREKGSNLPAPTPEELTRQPRVSDASVTCREEGRKERKEDDACASPASPPVFKPLSELKARGVDEQIAEDWLKVRKAKRAPLTQTALNETIREADKAGISLSRAIGICCKRSWTNFDASWMKETDLLSAVPAVKDYL